MSKSTVGKVSQKTVHVWGGQGDKQWHITAGSENVIVQHILYQFWVSFLWNKHVGGIHILHVLASCYLLYCLYDA
jgi:hypothetical protein